MRSTTVQPEQRTNSAWIIIVASGVIAGLHIWKLSPALGVIRDELGFSLIFSGVLLGVVQAAGMLGGLAVSLLAEVLSQRRTLILGLFLLILGSALGSFSPNSYILLATRMIEGAGVIMATVMGPGLVKRHAPHSNVNMAVGWWAAYMGLATFIGVFSTSLALQHISWQLWWGLLAIFTALPIPLIYKYVPPDTPSGSSALRPAVSRILITARSGRVWVSGLIFGCYTVQWMAVVGFLPTIYAEFGLSPVAGGLASAAVGGLNAVGAIICGTLLHRGFNGQNLLFSGFALMALAAVATFAFDYPTSLMWMQIASVGMFSLCGAAIPTTVTRVVVDLVPAGGSAPAAMGLAQQIFNIGNFTGPMLLAGVVSYTGGWNATWWMAVFFSLIGTLLTIVLARKNSPFASRHQGSVDSA